MRIKGSKNKEISNDGILEIFIDYIKNGKIPDGVDKTSRSWLEDGIMGRNKNYVVSRVAIFERRKQGEDIVWFTIALYSQNTVWYSVIQKREHFIWKLKKMCKDNDIKCYDFMSETDVTGWSEIVGSLNKGKLLETKA